METNIKAWTLQELHCFKQPSHLCWSYTLLYKHQAIVYVPSNGNNSFMELNRIVIRDAPRYNNGWTRKQLLNACHTHIVYQSRSLK